MEPRAQPVIQIDVDSATPVYRQIADSIRTMLVNGLMRPGDRLPPVRQLAVDLAVHFNTVAEAYRTLADEGWLDLRRRRGAQVIARLTPTTAPPQAEPRFVRRLRELVAASQAEGLGADTISFELRKIAKELKCY